MGAAVDVDMAERLVEVEVASDNEVGTQRAYVPCRCDSLYTSSVPMDCSNCSIAADEVWDLPLTCR